MRHVAAYLLLALGGNANPSAKDITDVLSSVGIEPNKDNLKTVVDSLHGKDLATLMAEGSKLLASVPSVGGGASAGPAKAADGPAPAEVKAEEKKAPEPSSDSEDEDMGLGLFDD